MNLLQWTDDHAHHDLRLGVLGLQTGPVLFCAVHILRTFEPHTLTREMVRCFGLRQLN